MDNCLSRASVVIALAALWCRTLHMHVQVNAFYFSMQCYHWMSCMKHNTLSIGMYILLPHRYIHSMSACIILQKVMATVNALYLVQTAQVSSFCGS